MTVAVVYHSITPISISKYFYNLCKLLSILTEKDIKKGVLIWLNFKYYTSSIDAYIDFKPKAMFKLNTGVFRRIAS